MSIQLEIPDSVVQAIRLPPAEQKGRLLLELALSLYARDLLPLDHACELCALSQPEFGLALSQRGLGRPAGDELPDDVMYSRR